MQELNQGTESSENTLEEHRLSPHLWCNKHWQHLWWHIQVAQFQRAPLISFKLGFNHLNNTTSAHILI